MKAIDMTTSGSLTRRQTMQYLAGIGAAIAAPRGDHLIAHAEARRSTPAAERRDERPRRRERHPRQPRISVRFDSLSSALHIDGERFAENARVNITIDSGSPHLDYSLPWSVASTRTVAVANNHGKLNESVRISPLGCIFTGRVEVVDRETGLRTTEDFRGSLC